MTFVIADRVKETSTSTSTGDFALAGAMTGFKTFASRCSVGDTVYYAIQGVDGTGVPTAEWECGLGTYSASNTLTRTTVTASSNADAAVSFSASLAAAWPTIVGWGSFDASTAGNLRSFGEIVDSVGTPITISRAIGDPVIFAAGELRNYMS